MNMTDALAALASAKASGDIAAILAAAEAIATVGAAPKPRARSTRTRAGELSCYKPGRNAARESIAVTFVNGETFRCGVWSDPGKPFNIGAGILSAVARYRARVDVAGQYDSAVPAFASVTRIETGEAFDADTANRFSADKRSLIEVPAPETDADRLARLVRHVESARASLAFRDRARRVEPVRLCHAWARAEGHERFEIETLLQRIAATTRQDVVNARRDLAACEARLAAARGESVPADAIYFVPSPIEQIECEPFESAYPDADDDADACDTIAPAIDAPRASDGQREDDGALAECEREANAAELDTGREASDASSADADPSMAVSGGSMAVSDRPVAMCTAHCSSHRGRDRLEAELGGILPDHLWTGTNYGSYRIPVADALRIGTVKGIRFVGLPRKPRQRRPVSASEVSPPVTEPVEAERPLAPISVDLPAETGMPVTEKPRVRVKAGSRPHVVEVARAVSDAVSGASRKVSRGASARAGSVPARLSQPVAPAGLGDKPRIRVKAVGRPWPASAAVPDLAGAAPRAVIGRHPVDGTGRRETAALTPRVGEPRADAQPPTSRRTYPRVVVSVPPAYARRLRGLVHGLSLVTMERAA